MLGAMDPRYKQLSASPNDSILKDNVTQLYESSGEPCSDVIPPSWQIIANQGHVGNVITAICFLCLAVTLTIYLEEIVFLLRHFTGRVRKQKTIYILGLTPTFSVCGMLGVMVPRAGVLVDLVANAYFGMVLYSLVCLLDDYLGGDLITASSVTSISFATPPFCCCCPCLPTLNVNRQTRALLLALVYQVTLVRPVLMFLSAVLWVDGEYLPRQFSGSSSYLYISVLNLTSTVIAVWILIVIQKSFRPVLQRFRVALKFLYIQLSLLGTTIGNITIAVTVTYDVIPCTAFMPSKARAGRIYHSFVIVWMLFVAVWGRFAFLRYSDGGRDPSCAVGANHELNPIPEQGTSVGTVHQPEIQNTELTASEVSSSQC